MSAPGTGEQAAAAADEQAPAAADEEASAAADQQPGTGTEEAPAAGPSRQPLADTVRGLPRRAAGWAGGLPPGRRIAAAAVLGVLAAGAAAAAVRLGAQAHDDAAVATARSTALAAARTEIRQILSYNYRTIGADLARARSDTTGEFRGEFGVLAGQLIGPAAAQQHTITWATVPGASVVSATADRVVVLLFIDQNTANKAQPQAQQVASQVRVTMQRVNGRWLVAQFQAL